jgi:N-hydroxyarylamine O-acetyltransferase
MVLHQSDWESDLAAFVNNTSKFNKAAYLERLGLAGEISPTIEDLIRLHNDQSFTIPFENLDIHLGREIQLDEASLVDKLITRRRGGYCFELNGLFCIALQAFGFTSERILARVLMGTPNAGPRTHQVMIVTIEGNEWLCDVGFGGPGMLSPLLISSGKEQSQFGMTFRLTHESGVTRVSKKQDGIWFDLYAFDRMPVSDVDLMMSNFYTSCFPASRFKLARICAIHRPTGRITLTDNTLAIYEADDVARYDIAAGEEMLRTLETYFGITGEPGFAEFRDGGVITNQ